MAKTDTHQRGEIRRPTGEEVKDNVDQNKDVCTVNYSFKHAYAVFVILFKNNR